MDLKSIREDHGWTQRRLSEESGINIRLIQHYEQKFRDINRAEAITVYRLAKALGVQMEYLINKEED